VPSWLNRRAALFSLAALIAVVAVAIRLPALGVSLWWDEAYSAHAYVPYGPWKIIDEKYYVPNNHVLFNLLAWATTSLIGTNEVILRFWSFVPAMAAAGLIGWWAWRRHGAAVGLIAGLFLVTSPVHLGLSVQARGYGLGFLAAALMLIGAVEAQERNNLLGHGAFVVGGLTGIWTLPQMLFLFAGHGLALLAWSKNRWRVVVDGAIVAAGTLVVYWVLIPDLIRQSGRVGSRTGDRMSLTGMVSEPAELLFAPSLWSWGLPLSTPFFLLSALLIGLAVLAGIRLRSAGRLREYGQIVLPWVLFGVALTVLGSAVLDRYISFLLVPLSMIVALGAVQLVSLLPASRVVGAMAGVALVLVAGTAMIREGRVWWTAYENYRDAVAVAHESGVDRIVTNREPGTVGFWFYDEGVEVLLPTESICDEPGPLVFLDFPVRPEDVDLACLEGRGGELVVVEQRRAPGGIDVWILRT
jgi:hypothetical protein